MSRMKDFLMKVSEDMGLDGEINDEVIKEAQDRMAEAADLAFDEMKEHEISFARRAEARRLTHQLEGFLKNKGT